MLDRWARQDPSTDPEWEIGDVTPLSLRRAPDSGAASK